LILDDRFRVSGFDVTFDVIVDSRCLQFLDREQLAQAMHELGKVVHPDSRLLSRGTPPGFWDEAAAYVKQLQAIGSPPWVILGPAPAYA
jgi:hypothetical protein